MPSLLDFIGKGRSGLDGIVDAFIAKRSGKTIPESLAAGFRPKAPQVEKVVEYTPLFKTLLAANRDPSNQLPPPPQVQAAREQYLAQQSNPFQEERVVEPSRGEQVLQEVIDQNTKISQAPDKIKPQYARYGNTGDRYITNALEALGLSKAEADIIGRESGFRPEAFSDKGSSAFGLFQITEGNRRRLAKRLGVKYDTTDPYEQRDLGRAYIKERYGSPENAVAFWNATANADPSLAPDFYSPYHQLPLRDVARSWIDQYGAHPGY